MSELDLIVEEVYKNYPEGTKDTLYHPTRGLVEEANCRQICMYLMNTLMGMNFAAIGKELSRDRTTVSYACKKIEDTREDHLFDDWLIGIENKYYSKYSN